MKSPDKILRYAGTDELVCLEMGFGDSYDGVILNASEEWWLLCRFSDFVPDGFACIRPRDVVRAFKARPFFQRIYQREGLLAHVQQPFSINLLDAKSILADLRKHCPLIILDFEYEEPTCLYLGRVDRLAKSHLLFDGIDPAGKWYEENPRRVDYEDISAIRFGTLYAEMFAKYSPALQNSRT